MARLLRSYPCPPHIRSGRLWILSSKPTVTYSPSASYPVNVAMTLTPTIAGVVNAGGFVVTAGALPTGLSLDADTGVISGTPTLIEAQTFTVTATNPYGTSAPSVTITIVAATGGGSGSSVPGVAGSPRGVLDEIVKKPGIRQVTWNTPGRGVRV